MSDDAATDIAGMKSVLGENKIDRYAVLNAELSDISGLTTDPAILAMAAALKAALLNVKHSPGMKLVGFTCSCGWHTRLTLPTGENRILFDCAGCERSWMVSE